VALQVILPFSFLFLAQQVQFIPPGQVAAVAPALLGRALAE